MSSPIITVENLGKRYFIGHQRASRDGLRHAIEETIRHPLSWVRRRNPDQEEVWALNEVSFNVKRGDVVGIIGPNGAGKSTLLKILSRITEPTCGRIHIRGRVASLLEVGTGFHQELTGRENIFLNGAILGMSKEEIKRKFDEIVDFSEVEKFLDTPVKRYSSGMYVRLAFAVAAHLEPEVLIVDEVLAVGDAEFQKKCLGKMHEMATGGRTVLFVSHNMQAISLLCNRGLLLRNGSIAYYGDAREAVQHYLSVSQRNVEQLIPDHRPGSGEYRFMSATASRECFGGAEEKTVNFEIQRRKRPVGKMWLSAHIVNSSGATVAQCDSRLIGILVEDHDRLSGQFRLTTPWLKPGLYRIDLFICAGGIVLDAWEGACSLTISPVIPYPRSASEDGTKFGLVFGVFVWETKELSGPMSDLA